MTVAQWLVLTLSHTGVALAAFLLGSWAMQRHRDEIDGVRSPTFREWWRSVRHGVPTEEDTHDVS